MFGWFRPRCPLTTAEKVWVETRMAWLAQTLSAERLREVKVIEPTDEFFPAPYHSEETDAKRIFRQVCAWMSIDQSRVQLELHDQIPSDGSIEPVGMYVPGEPARILIRSSQLADPECLVATMAHELAHEILIGGGHVQNNNEDLERLTDLTTVFCGMGIFCANAALREKTARDGQWSWWSLQKQGYLPMRMYGYGMSLFAWARDERKPNWLSHLRLDPRESMRLGLRYLWKTGDSVFSISEPTHLSGGVNPDEFVTVFAHSSTSFRFLGLSKLLEHGSVPKEAIERVALLAGDRDPDVASLAARLLGVIGEDATPYVPELLDMLSSTSSVEREQAAYALGAIRPHGPNVMRELAKLLNDSHDEVCQASAESLGGFGQAAQHLSKPLLQRYQRALIKCDSCIDSLAKALVRVVPDAQARVREYFSEIDPELCEFAERCLTEAHDDLTATEA
jgi:hypothetical protein